MDQSIAGDDANEVIDEGNEVSEVDEVINVQEDSENNIDLQTVAAENRADEVVIETADEDDSDSDIETSIVRKHQTARSGRTSCPFDYKKHYPGAAHMQNGNIEGKWLQPHYYDDESMIEKLGTGIFYKETYFSDNVSVKNLELSEIDAPIERWSDRDQCQLHHEALQWLHCNSDEIDDLCMKKEEHSMQKGVKVCGEKGKELALKEMKSLAIKINALMNWIANR